MSNILIKQGNHNHQFPPLTFLPWIGKQSIERMVCFDVSCEYDSAAYNSDDVNKLFGLSFGWGAYKSVGGPGYISPVHWNSARFGWRWSKADQCVELLAYCYVNGVRNWDEQLRFPVVAQVQPGDEILYRISYDKSTGIAVFTVFCRREVRNRTLYVYVDNMPKIGEVSVQLTPGLPQYGLTHGSYWGGVLTCPHDITLSLSRV